MNKKIGDYMPSVTTFNRCPALDFGTTSGTMSESVTASAPKPKYCPFQGRFSQCGEDCALYDTERKCCGLKVKP